MSIITTKPCTRCGGTGHYSFNLRHGSTCYGCGGTGKMPMAPQGQARIKPNATIDTAQVGDIIEHALVLYRVEEIRWIATLYKGCDIYNQKMKVTRLVDEKTFYVKRCLHGINPEYVVCWSISEDGTKVPAATSIDTPPALVGTIYEKGQFEGGRGI